MSDELDVLRHDQDVIEPDPQFRAELMDRLRQGLAAGRDVEPSALSSSPVTSDAAVPEELPAPVQIGGAASDRTVRAVWRLVAVAAAVVLIVAASVAVIQSQRPVEEEQEPSGPDDVFNELILGDAELYADVAPGTSLDLPPAPIIERLPAATVWTGRELVVWGGRDTEDVERFDDGAAFDPATGTWRTLAPAPIVGRDAAAVTWTGTELFIWGGYDRRGANPPLADGAAYNPTTDTWRVLPEAPITGREPSAVWTGKEVVVLLDQSMAAYDPESDQWQPLADPPGHIGGPVSSGETFLIRSFSGKPNRSASGNISQTPVDLVRYDRRSDAWEPVHEVVEGDDVLDITGADGLTRAVLVVPFSSREDVTILDPAGKDLGTLPPFPGGSFSGIAWTWAGEELLFTVAPGQGIEHWAVDLGTQTWRQLKFGDQPPSPGMTLATEFGVLFGVREPSASSDGPLLAFLYRPPTPAIPTGTGATVGDRAVLPTPGEQPTEPVAAEQQVRDAFTTIFDATRSRESRAGLSERPAVWTEANRQLTEGQYGDAVKDLQAEVDAVVFTAPSHAVVRFRFIASADVVTDEWKLGEAVLVDGRWLVAIRTTCDEVSVAGVSCDMSL